jgi:hypothetical protein
VGYRQWTLTLPRQVRWVVRKQPGLVREVERRLVRAVWRWQRAQARRLGVTAPLQGGAVGFLQLFGSALQLTPHLHVLLPEGLWGDDGEWVALPPPEDDEVEAVLHRLLRQLRATFAGLESRWPEEAEELLWAEAAQHRLPLEGDASPKKKARRLARAFGFSLHADTAVHAFDRVGLQRLCGYLSPCQLLSSETGSLSFPLRARRCERMRGRRRVFAYSATTASRPVSWSVPRRTVQWVRRDDRAGWLMGRQVAAARAPITELVSGTSCCVKYAAA